MRSLVLPALFGSLFVAACGQGFALAQRSPDSSYIIGAPIRHKNLTIFPVLSKVEQKVDRYITLDEGLRAGTVQVIEVGSTPAEDSQAAPATQQGQAVQPPGNGPAHQADIVQAPPQQSNARTQRAQVNFRPPQNAGNQVNQLMVVNKSGKPLYLMPGEVIVGGSQDRTIGNEMTIAPTGKPVPIDVFCVEHGRWRARDNDESASLYVALEASPADAQRIADADKQGRFGFTAAPLGKAGRVAVQSDKSQQAVWDNVSKNNEALRVESESGTFTRSYADKRVQSELEPYVAGLTAKVSGQSRVVGAIVAINGKIESLDVFESTPLFRKLWPKLLKSYALDAVSTVDAAKPADKHAKNAKVAKVHPPANESTVADASTFLNKVLQGTVRDKETKSGLVITHRETDGAKSYSAGGMGGGGGAIHAAGFAP
ncbi:MAG TPA: DUF6569 family protein [Planctomycetaceae bacterium]|jgi:hypothetical protein|nr:DUF6569 family protein [Planctomycetaceae bacterium]